MHSLTICLGDGYEMDGVIVFHFVNNIISTILYFAFLSVFFARKKWKPLRSTLYLVFDIIITISANLYFPVPIINYLTSIGSSLLIAFLFFEGVWKKKLIYVLLYQVLFSLVEIMIYWTIMMMGLNIETSPIQSVTMLHLLNTMVILLVRVLYKDSEFIQNRDLEIKLLLIVAIATFIIFSLISYEFQTLEDAIPHMISTVFLIVIIFMQFYYVNLNAQILQTEHQNKTLQLLYAADSLRYRQLLDFEKRLQKQRHDMKNMLIGIAGIPDEEKQAVILNMIGTIDESSEFYTGNPILQYLITSKIQNIIIPKNQRTIMIDIPNKLLMDPIELAVLVGNCVDNAVEAIMKMPLEERILGIEIKKVNGIIFLKFSNSYTKINRDFSSTKQDPKAHGYGLRSIRDIIKNYGGKIDINTDALFVVDIHLIDQ